MALTKMTFELLKQLLSEIEARPIKLVTVGYPDCLVNESYIGATFGEGLAASLSYREDSKDIIKWHDIGAYLDKIIETKSLLELLNIEMTILDINKVRGDEIICDLNESVSEQLHDEFDIVLDGGAMEHCFNVGQVINNFVAMAKVDGYIVHQNPLVSMNHGFFNFNPTFYYDYYTDNGHALISPIYGVVAKGLDFSVKKLPLIQTFASPPDRSGIVVVCQKRHNRANTWPTQSKYKIYPDLKK